MNYTTNSKEVADAIELLNINARLIPEDLCSIIFERVIKRFTSNDKYQYPLWENINNQSAVRRKYAWEMFNELLKDKEVILLFDYADDKNMFLFPDGGVLSKVFANCFGFIFYITNVENEFLLAYNDHDYLIGAGEAIKWIEDIESGK